MRDRIADWSVPDRRAMLGAVLIVLALTIPLRGYLTDDTFIHLQYARNLATGQGLVFNPSERVYGCTSPLWVALIAIGMGLHLDGLFTAKALGLITTLISLALFLELMRRTLRTPALRAAATIAWSSNAWMARWALSGMETPLAVALVLAGFVTFTEDEPWGRTPARTGALWALAALARPEAAVLLALWIAYLAAEVRRGASSRLAGLSLIAPAVIYGGWLVFAACYFHALWPGTLAAKSAGGGALVDHLANLWREIKIVGATDGALVAVLLLAIFAAVRRRQTRRLWSAGFVRWCWAIGLPLLYSAGSVPVLSRYLLPTLPLLAWLTWQSAESWWIGENTDAPSTAPAVRRAARFGVVLAALLVAQNLAVYRSAVLPQVHSFSAGLENSLVRWGRWFAQYTAPGAEVATPDIGAIGYYSQRHVLDLAGLVSPQMIPLLRHAPEEDVIAQLGFAGFARPDYLVDRAPLPFDLLHRSPYAACLLPIGHASVPNLGIARPGVMEYTIYRVDWHRFDALRGAR
ncbi:MAG: hypothetical protein ACRENS_04800 [Candidatus Eiseniibacteriota bacterium]